MLFRSYSSTGTISLRAGANAYYLDEGEELEIKKTVRAAGGKKK